MPLLNWKRRPYKNPLLKKFDIAFFASIPRGPGVYYFRDALEEVLYVGKAKNLRNRLLSYKRAKRGNVAKKILRMLDITETITWEECASEKDALLRENELLRELDPEFNVINTRPGSYFFIGLQVMEPGVMDVPLHIRFRLTRNTEDPAYTLYGCFRSKRRVKEGYGALLRLLWAVQCRDRRFSMPAKLTRDSPPYVYLTQFPRPWLKPLESFLEGRSSKLLLQITEGLLANTLIPEFMYHGLQRDLDTVGRFFRHGTRVNRRMQIHHSVKDRIIAQHEIDDLIVLEAARRGLVES